MFNPGDVVSMTTFETTAGLVFAFMGLVLLLGIVAGLAWFLVESLRGR
jgi:hypothetical protein